MGYSIVLPSLARYLKCEKDEFQRPVLMSCVASVTKRPPGIQSLQPRGSTSSTSAAHLASRGAAMYLWNFACCRLSPADRIAEWALLPALNLWTDSWLCCAPDLHIKSARMWDCIINVENWVLYRTVVGTYGTYRRYLHIHVLSMY